MNDSTIVISISPSGDVTVEAQGYRGSTCEDATKDIESALGVTESRKRTSEYDLPIEEKVHVRSTR